MPAGNRRTAERSCASTLRRKPASQLKLTNSNLGLYDTKGYMEYGQNHNIVNNMWKQISSLRWESKASCQILGWYACTFFRTPFLHLLNYRLHVWMYEYKWCWIPTLLTPILKWLRNCSTVSPRVTAQFTFHQQCQRFPFSTPSATRLILKIFVTAHPTSVVLPPLEVLI